MKNFDAVVSQIQKLYNTSDFIPLHQPCFKGNEKKYLEACIDSTFVSSVGKYVDQFEAILADITNTERAVAVVNGTAGIQVALRLAGVEANDEVLTQALTFVATANAISYNGAHPVFLDVDLDTMGLSPQAVSNFLEDNAELKDGDCYNKVTGRKISACLPMHTFGFSVHLDALIKVCNKWRIKIVEDAAEALGSTYKNKPLGSFGDLGVFSFNGNKITTSGGGGAIVTKDERLAEKGKYLTTTAKQPHAYEYFHNELGYNYRMPNINAALACAQLEQLNGFIREKRGLAMRYEDFFKSMGIKFRTETQNTKANYWLMCIELANKKERNAFLDYTNSKGVMTRPIWQLMFRLPMFKDCLRDSQKNAIFLEERIVNIPSSVRT
ncbi:LegC family aminotransferase [uncultured Winogradskyella sp.]|uniref:LegC family aminotransferase n=1 Tax=uncultured Winogradskyella sp. TaxID=395353 RepID=UPI002638BD8E|nr:LegC family aminotransferase [uncultured Winogradskyella sp.]